MGFSSLHVAYYHFHYLKIRLTWPYLAAWGYAGVDVFVLLSAFGCYHSLTSNSNVLFFLQKRFRRTMPTYYAFLIYSIITERDWIEHAGCIIPSFFGMQHREQFINWYVSGMWMYYATLVVLVPLCESYIDCWSSFLFLLFLLFLSTTSGWGSQWQMMHFGRLPILLVGTMVGKLSKNASSRTTTGSDNDNNCFVLRPMHYIPLFIAMIIGYFLCIYTCNHDLMSYGEEFYASFLFAPGFCVLMLNIFSILDKYQLTRQTIVYALNIAGNYCWEIFFAHQAVIHLCFPDNIVKKMGNLVGFGFTGSVLTILFTYILRLLTNALLFLFFLVWNKMQAYWSPTNSSTISSTPHNSTSDNRDVAVVLEDEYTLDGELEKIKKNVIN